MSQQLDQRVPTNLEVPQAADISFDDLFPPEGSVSPATAQSEQPAPPAPPPQAPETPEELFLKVPTGTVYKTQEEAIRGFAVKDETIERLRSQLISSTGVDPLTGKAVGAPKAAPQAQATGSPNYAKDYEAFWNATAKAVDEKNPAAWAQAQQKFISDTFAPIAPILQNVAKTNAMAETNQKLPGFQALRYSPEFNQMLDTMPIIKNAIDYGETNLEGASQLPELYRYAYLMYQGAQAAQIVRTEATPAPAQPQSARPTLTSSAMTPPEPVSTKPDFTTSEGRKAWISQYESRGGQNTPWRDIKGV